MDKCKNSEIQVLVSAPSVGFECQLPIIELPRSTKTSSANMKKARPSPLSFECKVPIFSFKKVDPPMNIVTNFSQNDCKACLGKVIVLTHVDNMYTKCFDACVIDECINYQMLSKVVENQISSQLQKV